MNKKKAKRRLLAFSTALLIATTYYNIDYVYHPSYEIYANDEDKAFGSYSKGNIYIGPLWYLKSLDNINEDDILVQDQRFNISNPNLKIFSSYRITDKELRNEILEVLCRYEECYPSPWDRSIESMRVEWALHNFSYYFNNRRDRTTDVDLNNEDEEKYDSDIARKILKL